MVTVKNILNNRGTSPRIYRNMLAFVAPDQDLMVYLKQATRSYLARKSIKEDSITLNLDATQNKETENNLVRQNRTVDDQIRETYSWLIVPYIDRNVSMNTIEWETIKLSGGNEGIVSKAAKKAKHSESIIKQWAPLLLKMQLDQLLWSNASEIEIKKLWEYLCTYCYLPRLMDYSVLENTIREGLNSDHYFAYCAGIENGRYVDLKFNQFVGMIDRFGYLVKVDAARKQIDDDEAKRQASVQPSQNIDGITPNEFDNSNEVRTDSIGNSSNGVPTSSNISQPMPQQPKNKRFFMSTDLDTTRINHDVQKYVEEVINHLTSVEGAKIRTSLEVKAEVDDGFSRQTVRTVSENCHTLRVRESGFEE